MPTTMILRALCAALPLTLAACAGQSFKPTEVNAFGTPYEGLRADSYGRLSAAPLRQCDPRDDGRVYGNLSPTAQQNLSEATHGIAATIASVLAAPAQGLMKIDSTLVDLRLADGFKVAADSNHPPVAVLSYNDQGIVFWHQAQVVRLSEVAAAAKTYCSRQNKTASHSGSATRCPAAQSGPGGMAVQPTYALSAFQCLR